MTTKKAVSNGGHFVPRSTAKTAAGSALTQRPQSVTPKSGKVLAAQ